MTDREHESLLRRISKRFDRRARAHLIRAKALSKSKIYAEAAACEQFAMESVACAREVLKLTRTPS